MFNFTRTGKLKKHLRDIQKHLQHIVFVNDDILSAEQKSKVREIAEEAASFDPAKDAEATEKFLDRAPIRVAKILPRQSFPTLREYLDIFAVAFMVAFGVRGIFLQPFKIPTSSMQPTLFGIHYVEDKDSLPQLPQPLHSVIFGSEKAEATVQKEGMLDTANTYTYTKGALWPWTKLQIDNVSYDLPGEADRLWNYYKIRPGTVYKQDEVLAKGWLVSGDHLFVDRWTLHFREPRRGDVIVFNTEDISLNGMPLSERGYYYIKRLVGLPGDTLKINDEMLYIKPKGEENFRPASEFNKTFKKLYSEQGGYRGHHADGLLSPGRELLIPSDCYFAMGDNTFNSSDGRAWGFVPRKNLVGLGFFVFWPLSRRWGPVDVRAPLPMSSEAIPSPMNLQ